MKREKSFKWKGLLFACMWIVSSAMFAQNITVKGTVTDANNEPVIGATVRVKGSSSGTVTDLNGNYSISLPTPPPPENIILIFTYVGYVTQEITYEGQDRLDVQLEEDTRTLDEVVVVGYGTQRRVNLTGAVESVSGSVLENRPITNIGQGLQGVVPNLNISMNNGGAPGASSSFNIRGTTSLNGGSPLVLVDNVQMDPNLVNPEDIESISVLKDAASAAIYGARAAYGVILITTKKGKIGQKPTIQFSTTAYWQDPALSFHNVNSMEFLTMKDLAYQNSGGSGHYYNEAIYDYAERYFNGTYPTLSIVTLSMLNTITYHVKYSCIFA